MAAASAWACSTKDGAGKKIGRSRDHRPSLRKENSEGNTSAAPRVEHASLCSTRQGLWRRTQTGRDFGWAPIRLDWFGFVLPALILNYFGQGALVLMLRDRQPVLPAVPGVGALPNGDPRHRDDGDRLEVVISGAFSLSQQGMQLSLLPLLDVQQTSPEESAQSPTAPSRMTSDVRSRAS